MMLRSYYLNGARIGRLSINQLAIAETKGRAFLFLVVVKVCTRR